MALAVSVSVGRGLVSLILPFYPFNTSDHLACTTVFRSNQSFWLEWQPHIERITAILSSIGRNMSDCLKCILFKLTLQSAHRLKLCKSFSLVTVSSQVPYIRGQQGTQQGCHSAEEKPAGSLCRFSVLPICAIRFLFCFFAVWQKGVWRDVKRAGWIKLGRETAEKWLCRKSYVLTTLTLRSSTPQEEKIEL